MDILKNIFGSKKHDDGGTTKVLFNKSIIEKMMDDCSSNPDVEVGGRYVGYVIDRNNTASSPSPYHKLLDDDESISQFIIILDYIPIGPFPEAATETELQPDREYQVWTFRHLQRMDEYIQVLGSWHSHIPNGLGTFSNGDHDSYHSKVNLPAWPFDFFLAGLIVKMPKSKEQLTNQMLHGLYHRGAKKGVFTTLDNKTQVGWMEGLPDTTSSHTDKDDYSHYIDALKEAKVDEVRELIHRLDMISREKTSGLKSIIKKQNETGRDYVSFKDDANTVILWFPELLGDPYEIEVRGVDGNRKNSVEGVSKAFSELARVTHDHKIDCPELQGVSQLSVELLRDLEKQHSILEQLNNHNRRLSRDLEDFRGRYQDEYDSRITIENEKAELEDECIRRAGENDRLRKEISTTRNEIVALKKTPAEATPAEPEPEAEAEPEAGTSTVPRYDRLSDVPIDDGLPDVFILRGKKYRCDDIDALEHLDEQAKKAEKDGSVAPDEPEAGGKDSPSTTLDGENSE